MIWIRAWRDRIIIVIIVVMIKGRTLWVLQIVLQNVKAIFIIKMVWKVIRLVNVVNPTIWQIYKSSIMIQEDKVMVHLIFQNDVEVCHGNMMNFKRMSPYVIKSLCVGYMPQLTSMEGLRKKWYMSLLIYTGDLRENKFYLAEMANCIVRFIRHYGIFFVNYQKGKRKK